MTGAHIRVDDERLPFRDGDTLLVALLRAAIHPTAGGCLCLGGDCPHCLATVDGVSYVRTCQVAAAPGMAVERHHHPAHPGGRLPPLALGGSARPRPAARHVHCDVVVIGLGAAGRLEAETARAAGKSVVALEAARGEEALGIYAGPLVVARSATETLCLHPRDEIVVATGAAEIQPVAPGAELAGLLTARAAGRLAAAGIELGRVVAIGTPPDGLEVERAAGEIERFEGEGRVTAVLLRQPDGSLARHPCDTAVIGLGLHPRDALARMGRGLPVRTVGDAAAAGDLPPCPRAGTVCPCAAVTVADLETVWKHGFHELELVKRASLAGTGSCQGAACLPWVRSFLAERGERLQAPFTARPLTRQATVGEVAAGAFHSPTPRTPLHEEHLRLGARMERAGGWWRPWSYGDPRAEARAVREAVSLGDVSTLGKFRLSGTGTVDLLEHLYPTRVADLAPGRSRYALLLDERGYVLDDGLVCRDGANRFTLTLTSAGANFGELWLRDWAEALEVDVRILNQTASLGAINVTGPRAAELLARAGVERLPGFARHRQGAVAGVDCRILRLSFTGELSYELHHAAADSPALWRRLLELGGDLGIRPHGLSALFDLRLEKGHLVVGIDTDFDSTPRRLAHEWAVDLEKSDFVGREALCRTDRIALDRRLTALEMELPPPAEGAVVWAGDEYAGYVTSSAESAALGRAVLLAWVALDADGRPPRRLTVDDREARPAKPPFYDPRGERSRARVRFAPDPEAMARAWPPAAASLVAGCARFRPLEGSRIVAAPAALDGLENGSGKRLRIAPDELLALAPLPATAVADPHAIVERETGYAAARVERAAAERFLAAASAWELPHARPAFAQGAIAGIPVKLLLGLDDVLFVVALPYAAALERRLTAAEVA